jgi:hypothetical protein
MDGNNYASLSGAARFLQGGGALAGWTFWCVDPSYTRTMADIRAAAEAGA